VGTSSGNQIDHNELLRMRRSNPQQSLESLAERLGCSLSTVKRHLRLARKGESPSKRSKLRAVPTMAQVLNAKYEVVAGHKRPAPATGRVRKAAAESNAVPGTAGEIAA
jgi:biotin operon repressor